METTRAEQGLRPLEKSRCRNYVCAEQRHVGCDQCSCVSVAHGLQTGRRRTRDCQGVRFVEFDCKDLQRVSAATCLEVLNEPHGVFDDESVGAELTRKGAELTRKVNLQCYAAIRKVTAHHFVLVSPNKQGSVYALNACYASRVELPGRGKDDKLLITMHTYDPWCFCGQEGENTQAHEESWKSVIGTLKVAAKHLGRAGIYIGEYGVGRTTKEHLDNDRVRSWLRTATKDLNAAGYGIAVWDDCGWFRISQQKVGDSDSVDIEFPYKLIDAIVQGFTGTTSL